MASSRRKHVLIVGAGAAGMSCAATLAQHPDKFKITVLEKNTVTGGQATSIPLDEQRFGASWMNNGVQGGSKIFKHTFYFFSKYGHEPRDIQLQVSFGKGVDGFWTNCFPSKLIEQFSWDIRKFGLFLMLIKWTLPVLGLVPIGVMLRVFLFKKDFGDKLVYPLIALFLGTGNQTASVPCAIVERLFQDPNMKLWDYDPNTLLANLPTMVTFDNLHNFYKDWSADLTAKGVRVRLRTEVVRVISRTDKGVLVEVSDAARGEPSIEAYDEIVLCTLAEDALRLLGKDATWKERAVLGGAAFYDDITVTHTDREYFERHYETTFKPDLCAEPKSKAQNEQIAFSRGEGNVYGGFRPMYYTKTYKQDPRRIEMSFNCSNYQHQLLRATSDGNPNNYEPVYQTIFLDKRRKDLWTIDEIDEDKVIARNWWHQLGHRWQHYLRVVPGMIFLQGKQHTWFAGSWTLVDMHELACVSGIAAAYHLGAGYRKFDDFAENFFSKYLLFSHGLIYSREQKRRAEGKM
ncbi:hypothetical protein CCHL11_05460 [Colletotrichum chlorophyti]|uniref:Uncharacterized protein n=1 Tax=Colletotrichum chlorophyti TaxID=708187 RepID=A0A1Q8RB91_9PEZI|nr:hypothetical protein CCHL11_05460 [Colletotrichum chlorophyti]